MSTLAELLDDQGAEFRTHLAFAVDMEKCLLSGSVVEIGDTQVNVRHLMTIKSALIIHLYNIVEAVMSRTMEQVGEAVLCAQPSQWSESTLKEWLRFNASIDLNGNEESRLDVVHHAASKLLGSKPVGMVKFKKPSGTWSDVLIHSFSKRLKVDFKLSAELAAIVGKRPQYGDKSPLQFLAERRNAIAHGRKSFESGAQDLTLQEISTLAGATLGYMREAAAAFQTFVDEKHYLLVDN